MSKPDFMGRLLCKQCHNGFHRDPSQGRGDSIVEGTKRLCECPCHCPVPIQTTHRGKRAEQLGFEAPTMFIGARS
ncbi:MAG: hypothetical protein CXZ00_03160 [Acidobacteria bacterium]|nr:MAG: hypothetical protein CXZ00_03160 [Acidobacteriota bacterium]